MSSLDKRKTRLVFTTCDTVRERGRSRAVVIEAQPYYAVVRLAGCRTAYPISYAAIFHAAARIAAEKLYAEKKAQRKGKKR
ncbi:MAG TPA: hypothetical protein VGH83_05620 [Candidatus Acidoferrum sp.]|jgi:hypothetical protein